MERARFQRLERAFYAAAALRGTQRQSLVEGLADDPDLRDKLAQMLADHDARTVDTLLAAGIHLRQDLAAREADRDEPVPATIGRFRVLGEIAHGGLGRVLRAEDPTIGRAVAIKILRPAFERQAAARAMLAEEGRLGGRLQHPSIVPVYEIGVTDGDKPYLAMKVVEGRDFASMLDARATTADQRTRVLAVFEQICQAIAYAHDCGVVHRDLKPHNVMVGAFGEVQVMDWGIALRLGEDGIMPGAATANRVSGTPSYMAPEQARGDLAHVDRRTDVFGLGAILCEILTGQPPYGTGTSTELLERARRADLVAVHAALRAAAASPSDSDLAQLALACLAAEPGERPADAGAVATAVHAHVESTAARLRRAELDARAATARAASERKVARLTAVLALVFVVACAGGAWSWINMQQRANAAERRLVAAVDNAERRFETADAPPATDLAAWDAALLAARNATALIDGDAPPALATRAQELLRDARRANDDLAFCASLSRYALDASATGRLDARPTVAALRTCFEERCGSLDTIGAEGLAQKLATIRWREELLQLIDEWARLELQCDRESRIARKLRLLGDELDGDEWRRRVRAAAAAGDVAALRTLADEPKAAQASAATLRHLAHGAMFALDEATAVTVLGRCVGRFPNDFMAVLDYSWMLLQSPTTPYEAVLRYVQSALALRPGNPLALEVLALALDDGNRSAEALEAIDAAVAAAPDASFLRSRGLLRARADQLDGAIDDLTRALESIDPSHNAWPRITLELAAVFVTGGDLDQAWDLWVAALFSPTADGSIPRVLEPWLVKYDLSAVARAHVDEPAGAWPAWLMLGLTLEQRSATESLQAFERVEGAPTWAMRYAAQRAGEMRTRLGNTIASLGAAQRAVDALPAGLALQEARRKLDPSIAELRAAGRHAIAAHLEGLLCERAGQPREALAHYRAAIAADRDAIEAWLRLHACVASVDGLDAADAEIRTLLAGGAPGPVLRLPLRAPRLEAAPANGGDFELRWTLPPLLDARRKPRLLQLRVGDATDPEPRHTAADLWLPPDDARFTAPAGVLAAGRKYLARSRLLLGGNSPPGPWSEPVVIDGGTCEAVPLDLARWASADTVVDPGDAQNDPFDAKNGYSLIVDGFDGERTGVATANGLPPSGRLGLFTIGAYDRPQSIRLVPQASGVVRIALPPGRYAAVQALTATAHGAMSVPIGITYEDGEPREVLVKARFSDWFDGAATMSYAPSAGGIAVVDRMDRVGRDGFEERNAARLFARHLPMDEQRVARELVFHMDHAVAEQTDTVGWVLAITLMRRVAPAVTAESR